MNEVRLTKDEDEKERRKSKRDSRGDHKQKNDTVSKSDAGKKGDAVMDNHTGNCCRHYLLHYFPEISNNFNNLSSIISAHKRKITLVKETPRPASPSLPEAQATNILLIINLVRPFTLNQIKELLSRTGTIIENGFWMDRIKCKCYVEVCCTIFFLNIEEFLKINFHLFILTSTLMRTKRLRQDKPYMVFLGHCPALKSLLLIMLLKKIWT